MMWPRNTCRWSTSFGKEAGKTRAVLRDRARADIRRSRRHPSREARRPTLQGGCIHLSEPSPQRTPVLSPAGASSRGQNLPPPTPSASSSTASSVTTCAKSCPTSARGPRRSAATPNIKVFVGAAVVVAPTDAEAQDKLAEYREYTSSEGALAHYSASVGVDFSRYGPDEPIRFVSTNAMRSNLEAITVRSRDTEWTPRKLLAMMVLGSRQAPHRRLAVARRGRVAGVGGRGGRRRLQPVAHGHPGMRGGLCGSGGAGTTDSAAR